MFVISQELFIPMHKKQLLSNTQRTDDLLDVYIDKLYTLGRDGGSDEPN